VVGGIGSPNVNNMPPSLVRKCLGKNKQNDCLQNTEHNNTRWECSFETQNRDEFMKHCKNISKRVKWRDLIDNAKTDKEGFFRCVYYSTDRHHVENHYQKGSADMTLSPSPQQVMRYRSFMQQRGYGSGRKGKRDMDDADDDDNISPEDTAREMKKLKQDASLLGFFQEQHMDGANGESGKEVVNLPDGMKTVDLIVTIIKKLELAQEMGDMAIEKLHKQGFIIASGLKSLKKEGWEKLALPLAIEEELRNQITQSKTPFAPWYGMGVPFGWAFPHQVWTGQYNNMGQPIFVPYGSYENQDAVLGMGEVSTTDKDKEKTDDKETESSESIENLEHPSTTAPMVTLVPPDVKQEASVIEEAKA